MISRESNIRRSKYLRLKKHLLAIAAVVGVWGQTGCRKSFDELNQNPNLSTEIPSEELFAQAQFSYHTDYFNGVLTDIWSLNTWMQVQANINGIASADDRYFISGDATNNTWQVMYSQVLGNVNEAIRLSEGIPEELNKHNIYRIYRAYIFLRLTDLWGHIPYAEALDVINPDNAPNFTPAYDPQSVIYPDLLAELEEAGQGFVEGGPSLGVQDWIYDGNTAQWERLANSLSLRIAVRMADAAPELSASTLATLIARDRFITANTDNALFPYSGVALNPFFQVHNQAQGQYHPSDLLVSILLEDDDPRIEQYIAPSSYSQIFGGQPFVGVESFLLSSEVPEDLDFNSSYIAESMLSQNRAGVLFSAAETHFLLAEVAARALASGPDAELSYSIGVALHMESLGLESGISDAYLTAGGSFTGSLEQIAREKWKTFVFSDAVELWTEWRRTGFPVLKDAEGTAIDISDVPRRLPYPQSEISLNAENVSAVGHGINDLSTPMWWDVN